MGLGEPRESRRVERVAVALLAGLCCAGAARAAIEASSGQATVRLPQSEAPAALGAGADAFSFIMWLRRAADDAAPMYLIHAPGALRVYVDPSIQAIRAELEGPNDTLSIALPLRDGGGNVPVGEWILIAVSWDRPSGVFAGWARSETVGTVADGVTQPGFTVSGPAGDLAIGRPDVAGAVAQHGLYGLMVIREHAIVALDFDHLWLVRQYLAPYTLDNTAAGGTLNGTGGVAWMVNHAIPTLPVAAVFGTPTPALVGGPVTPTNFCVYRAGVSGFFDPGTVTQASGGADAFLYRSPFDAEAPNESFLKRKITDIGLAGPPAYVQGAAARMRKLAFDAVSGVSRVIVSANSRGVVGSDGDEQTFPENYAHGFIAQRLASTLGILNRPAAMWRNARWFGYDCTAPPRLAGAVHQIGSSGATVNSYGRFSTNSTFALGMGPGTGLFLFDGALVSMKCRPEAGSLMDGSNGDGTNADFPLHVRAYLLSFPGAGSVESSPERAVAQQLPGLSDPPVQVDLDTTILVHALSSAGGDTIEPFLGKITIGGDLIGVISAGDACFISGGAAANCISVVSFTQLVAGPRTAITFEKWFALAPVLDSSTLRFGPWSIETIDHEFPALSAGDAQIWRGLALSALGGPVVVFSYDAWRPGVAGFAFGTYGTGGHGYQEQINDAFSQTHHRLIAALQPDIWLEGIADQNSQPSVMSTFLDVVRAAAPGVEAAWIGESAHTNALSTWHHYIIDNAELEGIPAASVVEEAGFGSIEDQGADGLRGNANHYSHRGNVRLAERWLSLLQSAALQPGDLDGNGDVNVSDLLAILGAWGPCADCDPPSACPADIDGDCEVGVLDLLAILSNWGS